MTRGCYILAYGSKEKTNTGWKFLNNYINKREKHGDEAKNQLYKFVAYNIKWKSESRCVWSQSSLTVTYVISSETHLVGMVV